MHRAQVWLSAELLPRRSRSTGPRPAPLLPSLSSFLPSSRPTGSPFSTPTVRLRVALPGPDWPLGVVQGGAVLLGQGQGQGRASS